ncbi:hypothetical protein SDC9_167528 [bioreactor metagenome]|uniref:Phosphatidic acid phosphatase type 2/haloperoxidase domain-containing protein n=1 Tax=bioreactor metagenome TaxID=1076179 RepID=A0A645G017_9ZZZZ|nr:phosphatase PAP2 family protein [Anaerotignum sp.]
MEGVESQKLLPLEIKIRMNIMNVELEILDLIQIYLKNPIMDIVMVFITSLADSGWIWIITAVLLLYFNKTRHIGIAMMVAIILEVVICNLFLKPVIARPRPFVNMSDINLLIEWPKDYSFPSGHAAVSFAGAVTLIRYKSKLALPAMILAVLISFSRMYLYVHYPSDILVGAVIGSACAILSVNSVKKWYRPKKD